MLLWTKYFSMLSGYDPSTSGFNTRTLMHESKTTSIDTPAARRAPLYVWGDFSTLLLIDPDQERIFRRAMRIMLTIALLVATVLLCVDGILDTL